MSARLVGWLRNGGRVDLSVGGMARLGAAAGNDVVLPVDDVSRAHARVVRLDDGYWVEDAGSRNGTCVNGRRITRSPLKHLDVITLGRRTDVIFLESGTGTSPGASVAPAGRIEVRLEWLDGPDAGTSVPVGRGELVIGRGDASAIVVDNPAVSRNHARVTVTETGVTAEDLGSANGTRLNGQPLKGRTPLGDGDEIEVGAVRRLRVRIVAAAPASPAAEAPGADSSWRTRLVFAGELPPMPTLPGGELLPTVGALASAMPPKVPASELPGRTVRAAPSVLVAPPISDAASGTAPEGRTLLAPPGAVPVPSGLSAQDGAPQVPAPATVAGGYDIGPPPSDLGREDVAGDRTVFMRDRASPPRTVRGLQLRGATGVFTLPLGRSTVGRAPDVTVWIDSREVSRVHAVVVVDASGATVEDQGSANGTTVNGKQANGVQPLADGDRVAFGSFDFVVEVLRTGGAE